MRRKSVATLLTVAFLLALGCVEPKVAVPERAPSPLPPGAPSPGAPEIPWAQKSRAEKMEFMGLHFFPEMRALFRSENPKGEPFRCQTCHGEDMEAVDFRMPNGLFPLPKEDPVAAATDYDAKTTTFMKERVVPLYDRLIGDTARVGSPCHSCHPVEQPSK